MTREATIPTSHPDREWYPDWILYFHRDNLSIIRAITRRCGDDSASTELPRDLVGLLGYQAARRVAQRVKAEGNTIKDIVLEENLMSEETFDAWVAPEAVTRLGSEDTP